MADVPFAKITVCDGKYSAPVSVTTDPPPKLLVPVLGAPGSWKNTSPAVAPVVGALRVTVAPLLIVAVA